MATTFQITGTTSSTQGAAFPFSIGSVTQQLPAPDFRILFATPLNSNTVRVFFSREMKHVSRLASDDALNRLNWILQLTTPGGDFVIEPEIEKIENPLYQGAFLATIGITEIEAWSVDIRTSRRLSNERSDFLVIASTEIISQDGVDTLAANPFDRDDFPGIVVTRPLRPTRPDRARQDRFDYRYEFFNGTFGVDSKNDYDVHSGLEALKKRIIRRMITTAGGFAHLPSYGAGLRTKELFNQTKLNEVRDRVLREVQAEEEVRKAAVDVSFQAGVLYVKIEARTQTTGVLRFRIGVNADTGRVVA